MHVYETCLSRIIINYRHVSIAVAVIVRVPYRITGSPNKLLKMHKRTTLCYKECHNP